MIRVTSGSANSMVLSVQMNLVSKNFVSKLNGLNALNDIVLLVKGGNKCGKFLHYKFEVFMIKG